MRQKCSMWYEIVIGSHIFLPQDHHYLDLQIAGACMCRLYSKSFCQKLNLEVALNLQLTFLQTYQELSKIRGINLKLPKILRLDSFEACIRWRMPRFHQILLKNSSSFFSLHTFRDITNIKNIYKYHKLLQISFFVIEKVFLFSTHNFKYYVRR